MRFREATRRDSDIILQHRIGMFEAMGASEEELEETKRLTEDFIKRDWTEFYRYFLLEEADSVVGGCGLSTFIIPPQASQKTGVYGYISNMYVKPELRGKGFGRALLQHIIRVCKDEAIGLLILHASTQGFPLYESEGFKSPDGLMHLLVAKQENYDYCNMN